MGPRFLKHGLAAVLEPWLEQVGTALARPSGRREALARRAAVRRAAAVPTAVIGGVAGFGTGLAMLPLFLWAVGGAGAPILSLALLLGNPSRAWFSHHELDWRVVAAYLAGALPLAILGSVVYVGPARLARPPEEGAMLASVRLRRWLERGPMGMGPVHFPATAPS